MLKNDDGNIEDDNAAQQEYYWLALLSAFREITKF